MIKTEKLSKWWLIIQPEIFGWVALFKVTTLYRENPNRKHKPLSTVSTEIYKPHKQARLECCHTCRERPQSENKSNLFCRKALFSDCHFYQILDERPCMK